MFFDALTFPMTARFGVPRYLVLYRIQCHSLCVFYLMSRVIGFIGVSQFIRSSVKNHSLFDSMLHLIFSRDYPNLSLRATSADAP